MRDDVCSCYLLLVLNAFSNEKVKNCMVVKEKTLELKTDMGDESSVISMYFEFTGSKKDYILTCDLISFHKSTNLNVSIGKLKDIMRFNGAVDSNHLGDDKSQRGFYGAKLIRQNDEV